MLTKIGKLSIFFITATLLSYSACRKTDQMPEQKSEAKKKSAIEERFFNSNRTPDPAEKALVDFIKRKNSKDHFVEQTVKQIGYPRWDKIVTTASKNKIAGRVNSDSSLTTYYLPFVRDSQNYVNASMVIRTYPSDTIFSYKCDWQYSERQNNLNSYADSAEYYAIFFMVLDRAVFGHTEFEITDTTIFRHNNHKPLRIKLDSLQIGGRNNLLEPIELCQETTISWQDCPWNNTNCAGAGGICDNCWQCTSSVSWTYCWTAWIETGGSGGSGGTGGSGSGGTSSGGGSTPPPCGGSNAARNQTQQGCEPGWNPDPTPVPTLTYLTNILGLSASQVAFLLQYPSYQEPLYNYISQNYSSESVQICKDHIDLLITDPEYMQFVNNHDITGNHSAVWWMDDIWLDNPLNFNLDITRANNQYDKLTAAEKALVAIYPVQAYRIKQNVQRAFSMSDSRMGTSGGLNDKKDAFRHAFFQAINTRDVPGRIFPIVITGSAIVTLFANAHESEVPSQLNLEKQMDLFNNGIGISYCWNCWTNSNNSIADAILNKLNNGELKYLSPLDLSSSTYWPAGLNGILPSTTLKWTNQ
jgi:hypothetical protein